MLKVNELSPVFITVTFRDETGALITPTTVDWRLDDISNKNEILDWAPLTPSNPLSFTVPATANAVADVSRSEEIKEVVIRADDGLAGEAHTPHRYTVINIQGVV